MTSNLAIEIIEKLSIFETTHFKNINSYLNFFYWHKPHVVYFTYVCFFIITQKQSNRQCSDFYQHASFCSLKFAFIG